MKSVSEQSRIIAEIERLEQEYKDTTSDEQKRYIESKLRELYDSL